MPDPKLVAAAAIEVQGPLAELIIAAESGPAKARVAAKLLAAGLRADDSARSYAALSAARDWAVLAGDPATALAALDALGRRFDVDLLELKSQALGAALAGRVTSEANLQAARSAYSLAIEAVAAGRDKLALTLADTAYHASRKSRDSALTKRAYRLRTDLSAKLKSADSRSTAPKQQP